MFFRSGNQAQKRPYAQPIRPIFYSPQAHIFKKNHREKNPQDSWPTSKLGGKAQNERQNHLNGFWSPKNIAESNRFNSFGSVRNLRDQTQDTFNRIAKVNSFNHYKSGQRLISPHQRSDKKITSKEIDNQYILNKQLFDKNHQTTIQRSIDNYKQKNLATFPDYHKSDRINNASPDLGSLQFSDSYKHKKSQFLPNINFKSQNYQSIGLNSKELKKKKYQDQYTSKDILSSLQLQKSPNKEYQIQDNKISYNYNLDIDRNPQTKKNGNTYYNQFQKNTIKRLQPIAPLQIKTQLPSKISLNLATSFKSKKQLEIQPYKFKRLQICSPENKKKIDINKDFENNLSNGQYKRKDILKEYKEDQTLIKKEANKSRFDQERANQSIKNKSYYIPCDSNSQEYSFSAQNSKNYREFENDALKIISQRQNSLMKQEKNNIVQKIGKINQNEFLETQIQRNLKDKQVNITGKHFFQNKQKINAKEVQSDEQIETYPKINHQITQLPSHKPQISIETQQQKIKYISTIQKLQLQKTNLQLQVKTLQDKLQLAENKDKLSEIQKKSYKSKQNIIELKINEYQKQIIQLKNYVNSIEKNSVVSTRQESFDGVLKEHLEDNCKLKDQVANQKEQIQRLNAHISQNKRKAEQAMNSAAIQKLKYLSQINQIQQKYDIILNSKDNQLKTISHTMQTLEGKLIVAVNDSKAKDNFLKQYLIGRLKSEQQKNLIYQILEENKAEIDVDNIRQRILQEQKIIQELRAKLSECE